MKLLEPIQVGKMTLKNRIMFPPLTTGYEERDGSIGQKSLSFYERPQRRFCPHPSEPIHRKLHRESSPTYIYIALT